MLVIVKYMDASNLGTFRDSTLFPKDLTTVTVAFFPQTSVFSRSKLILWSEFPRWVGSFAKIFDSKAKCLSNSYSQKTAAGSTKTKVKEEIEPTFSDEFKGDDGEWQFAMGAHPIFILSIHQVGSTTGISAYQFYSVLAKETKYIIRNRTSKL